MADKKLNGRRGDFTSSSTNMADEADLSSLYFSDDPSLSESYRSYYQSTRKDMWKSISSRIPSQSEISDVSSVEDAVSESTISGSPIRTDAYPDSEDFQSIINEYEGYEDPPCTLLPPTSFVTIADDYDCIITTSCDRETRKFRVLEKVLSISSPVLRKLIVEAKDPTLRATKLDETDNGEFLGSDQDDSSISLTLEGDPRAFEIVLQIIHYQEDDEKLENLEFDIFTQIVFLCEKYGWHKALRRWTRFWLEKYEPHALKPGYENWLYVTQVFKTKKDVAKLSKLLGESCGIFPARRSPAGPGEGRFLSRDGKVVDAILWPSDMFFQISRARDRGVNHLVFHIRAFIRLVQYPSKVCNFLCLALSHGYIMRSLEEAGIWMILSDDMQWHGSLKELQRRMSRMQFCTFTFLSPTHKCPVESAVNEIKACIRGGPCKGTCI